MIKLDYSKSYWCCPKCSKKYFIYDFVYQVLKDKINLWLEMESYLCNCNLAYRYIEDNSIDLNIKDLIELVPYFKNRLVIEAL